jgi:predicted membrane protein
VADLVTHTPALSGAIIGAIVAGSILILRRRDHVGSILICSFLLPALTAFLLGTRSHFAWRSVL